MQYLASEKVLVNFTPTKIAKVGVQYMGVKFYGICFLGICLQEPVMGPCRGNFLRWHYDMTKGMCVRFQYGGCRGNQNNFESYDECYNMCDIKGKNII